MASLNFFGDRWLYLSVIRIVLCPITLYDGQLRNNCDLAAKVWRPQFLVYLSYPLAALPYASRKRAVM